MDKLSDIFASRRWPVISLLAITFLVYSNTLFNGFFYDDFHAVIENVWIKDFRFIPKIFTTHLWGFKADSASFYYRPIFHIILMIDYYLFGLSPWGYHLVNVIFHSAVTVLLFLTALVLFRRIEKSSKDGGEGERTPSSNWPIMLAFVSALIFSLHPSHVEPVAWVAAITELSFSLFFMLSLYLYMLSTESGERGWLYFILSLIAFAASMLCKETALTLIAVIVLFDLCFGIKGSVKLSLGGLRLRRYLPYGALILCYFLIRLAVAGSLVPEGKTDEMSTFEFVVNIFPLLSDYILFFIFPVELNIFRVFHPVAGVGDARFLLSIIVIIPLVLLLVLKRRDGLIVFTLLSAFFTLLPALYIPAVGGGGSVFAERYIYLPSAALVVLSVYLFMLFLRRFTPRSALTLFVAGTLLVAGASAVKSFTRSKVWVNEYTLWKDSSTKTLDSALVFINLGAAADSLGLSVEGKEAYESALKIDPNSAEALNNLGAYYYETKEYERSLELYARGLRETSREVNLARINENMGNVYYSMGKLNEAVARYRAAIDIKGAGKDANLLNKLGIALARSGKIGQARGSFRRALEINPAHKGARENLSKVEGL